MEKSRSKLKTFTPFSLTMEEIIRCKKNTQLSNRTSQGWRLEFFHLKTFIWMFPKIGVFPPKSSILIGPRVFHYKPSILGYPYFWKHPFSVGENTPTKPMEKQHLGGATNRPALWMLKIESHQRAQFFFGGALLLTGAWKGAEDFTPYAGHSDSLCQR